MGDVQYNFFGESSPYLTHPLLTSERTRAEVDTILDLVPKPDRVIDIGCGFGRHVVELAERGITTVGVDPSPQMCVNARSRLRDAELSADAGLSADIHESNLTAFADQLHTGVVEPFDLALLLFTTFGQIGADTASPAHQLVSLRRLLNPGGHVVIEVPERERALDALVAHEQLGPTTVTRAFNETNQSLHEQFESPGGTHTLGYRLFSREELSGLLTNAGFVVTAIRDTALAPPPLTFMTLVAQRPNEP